MEAFDGLDNRDARLRHAAGGLLHSLAGVDGVAAVTLRATLPGSPSLSLHGGAAASGVPEPGAVFPILVRGERYGELALHATADCAVPGWLGEHAAALAEVLALALENTALGEADLHAGLMLQRQLIANEVHDSLAQNLTSVRLRTALLRDALAKRDAARATGYLAEIDESLALAQSRVRDIITDFRSQLGATQLLPALESTVQELRAASGVDIDLQVAAHEPQLTAFEQLQVFYIVREALTNALQHAHANRVSVRLSQSGSRIDVCVEDNGVGLEAKGPAGAGHYGLGIMQERAARVGATLRFDRGAGGGTCVRLELPARGIVEEAA